jgi:hypothetical protein
MKHRWIRWIGPMLLVAVLALGGCAPPDGGGDGGAPANDGY